MITSNTFSNNDINRLLKLLEYSKQAIDYWFDGCDIDDKTKEENRYFSLECENLIKEIKNRPS